MQTYNPSVSYADSSTKARLRMPQALLRCPYTGEPIEADANLLPQSPNAASSTKARLRMPQALLRCPYTGEPLEVRTDLIQRHKQKPPLCKGRGTALVVEGLSIIAQNHK